jgi:AraC-like DNA-binding protein
MPSILGGVDPEGLERSCESIRFGPSVPGLERAEVHLRRSAYAPHRHDTYALGVTTAGVQRFGYRGERRICLPGQLHVLHPDELHDGAAATPGGFAYRILYVGPELVRAALGGRALPFVADPVHDLTPAIRPVAEALAELDEPLGDLAVAGVAAAVADALTALAGSAQREGPIDLAAVERVREHLATGEPAPADALEAIAGLDRFTLARQFRRAYGTSPDRYRAQRRLARARTAIAAGEPLARAAADAGFADQSHLTRQFKRAYGLTPARWAALTRARTTRTPPLR